MDAFELNKIAGAVLFALLILFGTKTATDILFKAHKPEKPGYEVAVTETATGGEAGEKKAEAVPLAVLLVDADSAKGEKVAKKCAACHTFDKGGANKIGPNLYGVVGRELGAVEGFAYSGALKGKGGSWGYEELDAFIANPKGFIDGTKMAFAGVRQPKPARRPDHCYLRDQERQPAAAGDCRGEGGGRGRKARDRPSLKSPKQPEPETTEPAAAEKVRDRRHAEKPASSRTGVAGRHACRLISRMRLSPDCEPDIADGSRRRKRSRKHLGTSAINLI